MKNKRILFIFFICILAILLFFVISNYKKINLGNNIISDSSEKITTNILNMSSFTATANVSINSNKNSNEYTIKQEYRKGFSMQEIVSDGDIKGVKIINEDGKIKIFNMKLNQEKIYDRYEHFLNSSLFLSTFIEDFKKDESSKFTEDDNNIILEAKSSNPKNRYICNKKLYIDKKSKKPTKIEIKDITEKGTIYILYSDIELSM